MNLRAILTRMLNSGNPTAVMTSAVALQNYEAIANQLAQYRIGKPTYPDVDAATLANEGHQKIALIARCVSLIADAAGVAPLRVYDEAQDDKEIPDHPMRALMRRPNPYQGPSDFLGEIAMTASLAGFCVIEKERNNAGQVIALWPLEPDRMRAVLLRNSAPSWDYTIPGQTKPHRFRPDEVVHFKWRNRFGRSPYGLSALEPAIREMALLNQMTDFLKVLFEHGGVPLWGLIPDPAAATMNQEKADELQDRFIQRRGGLKNAGIPMVMSGIKDMKQFGLDPNQLALVAVRDLSDLAICTAFGIPPRKAGVRAGLEHSTQNATAQVEDGEFYRDTMIPFWTRLDEAFTSSLLPDFDQRPTISIGFDLSKIEALQEDRNAKGPWVNDAVRTGWMSAHTAADELKVARSDGDDFFIRSFTVEVIPASDPLGAITAAEAEKKAAESPPPLPPGTEPKELPASLAGKDSRERYAKRAAIGATNKRNVKSIATRMQPRIASFFKAEGARILAKVDVLASDGPTEIMSIAEIDWDDEATELNKTLRSLYEVSGETAFAAVAEQLGVTIAFDLANPHLGAIRSLLAQEVTNITAESKAQIQDVLTDGLNAGKSIAEIRDDLKETFADWSTIRAETVARTESMYAYGYANAAGFRESGVVDRIQCFDNPLHTDSYDAEDGLSCSERDGFIDSLESAELHLSSEHVNGSLVIAPILTGEAVD